MLNFKSIIQALSMVFLDVLAFYVSLFFSIVASTYLANLFSKDVISLGFTFQYYASIPWILPLFLLVFQFQRLYRVRYPFWEEARILIKAVTIAAFFCILTISVKNLYGNPISAWVFVFLWAAMIVFSPLIRYWGKKLLNRLGVWKENVLILGAGESGIAAMKGIANEEHLGYQVIGFLDDSARLKGASIEYKKKKYQVHGSVKEFPEFVKKLKVDTVFISNTGPDQKKLTDLVNRVYKEVKRVILIPDIKGVAIFNSELHYLFMEKMFLIKVNNNLNSMTNILVKRAFDLTLALVGLLLALPVFLVIALLVKLTSQGPVIYSHRRVGKHGREFKAFKFRTMYRDSKERLEKILTSDPAARKEWEASYKLRKDPRVTPLGALLRKTSLDEIPQIFNIILGQMSLVGPRPVIREEIDKYYGNYREYYYSVNPGLTGLWQVSGRSNTSYAYRIETDAWYVQNWSLWLDVLIILRTVPALLKREGAY